MPMTDAEIGELCRRPTFTRWVCEGVASIGSTLVALAAAAVWAVVAFVAWVAFWGGLAWLEELL